MRPQGIVSKLARQAPPILAVGVFAGLLFPGLAMVLRPLLAPCVWGLLVLAMFRTDWPELARRGRRFGLIALIVAWLLLISPVMIAIALNIAGAPASLTAAMVLMAWTGARYAEMRRAQAAETAKKISTPRT